MGGFTVLGTNGKEHPVVLRKLKQYLAAGDIKITKKQIEDRSKSDILSRGIILFQTGWFILQLIARAIQHLPITELELVALAFATLNFMIYGVWWNKPLDVQCAFVLAGATAGVNHPTTPAINQVGSRPLHGSIAPNGDIMLGKFDSVAPTATNPNPVSSSLWQRTIGAVVSWLRSISVRQVVTGLQEAWSKVFDNLLDSGRGYNFRVFFEKKQRVPTFYWGTDLIDSDLYWSFSRSVFGIVTLVAMTFGAIHCIAWSFQMPTEVEKMLWRIAACLITAVPLPFTIIAMLQLKVKVDAINGTPWAESLRLLIEIMYGGTGLFTVPLYLIARVILLVQPFLLLRALPGGAYNTVLWTTFIPHI
jgi:hypothetical protein